MKIATIGFFDGVHRGHQFLFDHLRRLAQEREFTPLIVTFDNHPRATLQSDYQPAMLSSREERQELLERYGEVLMLPFEEIHAFTAQEFMTLLHDRYDVRLLVMGYDHRFGSDRLRRPQDYRRVGEACCVEVITMGECGDGEYHVSSTEIRSALENGSIGRANELLGRPYTILGEVVHGKGVGRTRGFPTANIRHLAPEKITHKSGVYMATVTTPVREDAPAFVNIDKNGLIEVYIPSFKGDLYGAQLKIRFVRFIRDEKHFDSLQELQAQIKDDIDSILRPV